MRKKISCKVISTIPLGKSIDELRSASRPSDKSHNNATRTSDPNRCAWETTTNPRIKDFSKSVIYTDRLDIKNIPIDNGLKTPRINFYA
ncbi:MAG: hypothetical protein ACYS17_14310 [Planctomycetota bacterium]|jgi:hypothetical protein